MSQGQVIGVVELESDPVKFADPKYKGEGVGMYQVACDGRNSAAAYNVKK
jgi:hypothetical protein